MTSAIGQCVVCVCQCRQKYNMCSRTVGNIYIHDCSGPARTPYLLACNILNLNTCSLEIASRLITPARPNHLDDMACCVSPPASSIAFRALVGAIKINPLDVIAPAAALYVDDLISKSVDNGWELQILQTCALESRNSISTHKPLVIFPTLPINHP